MTAGEKEPIRGLPIGCFLYPLIMSDDADQTVYHATCAVQLATESMIDLYTFFSPPAPYNRLFVLTALEAASPQDVARR